MLALRTPTVTSAWFAALCVVSAADAQTMPAAWQPVVDEVRSGLQHYHYRFDSLGGSPSQPVRIAVCPDPACSTSSAFATVRADSFSSPTPTDLARPYFLVARGRDRRLIGARRLALEGAFNFRDLGGLQMDDGRRIRWGWVYRSDDLNGLTTADFTRLNRMDIALVCDLRWQGQRQSAPTNWQGADPVFVLAPVGEHFKDGVAVPVTELLAPYYDTVRTIDDRKAIFRQSYVYTILNSAANIGTVIRAIASWDRPSVFHCSSGRDRTGITTAILLRILGAPRATIVSDFLLSDRYVSEGDSLTATPSTPSPSEARVQREFDEAVALDRRLIDTIFVTIDQRYGGFDAYRRTAMHVSDSDVANLKKRLLTPASDGSGTP
jgi:protein-tyrosine phosphatase